MGKQMFDRFDSKKCSGSGSGGCFDDGADCGRYGNCTLCLTVLRFARMWGVMETLGKLPPMCQKDGRSREYEKLVLDWAKEYDAGKGKNVDLVEFFEGKLESVWKS